MSRAVVSSRTLSHVAAGLIVVLVLGAVGIPAQAAPITVSVQSVERQQDSLVVKLDLFSSMERSRFDFASVQISGVTPSGAKSECLQVRLSTAKPAVAQAAFVPKGAHLPLTVWMAMHNAQDQSLKALTVTFKVNGAQTNFTVGHFPATIGAPAPGADIAAARNGDAVAAKARDYASAARSGIGQHHDARNITFTVQSVERQGDILLIKFDLIANREKAKLQIEVGNVSGTNSGGTRIKCTQIQLGNANPGGEETIHLFEGDHYPFMVSMPMRAAAENSVRDLSVHCRINDAWSDVSFENLIASAPVVGDGSANRAIPGNSAEPPAQTRVAKNISFTVQSVKRQGDVLAIKFDLVSQEKTRLRMVWDRIGGISVGGAEIRCANFQLGNADPGGDQTIHLFEGDHYPLIVSMPMRAATENSVKSLSMGCLVNDNWVGITFENIVASAPVAADGSASGASSVNSAEPPAQTRVAKNISFTVQSVERQGNVLAIKFDVVSQREKARLRMVWDRIGGVSVGGAEIGCANFQLGNADPGRDQTIHLSEGDHYPLTVSMPMRAATENSVQSLWMQCQVNDNWVGITFEKVAVTEPPPGTLQSQVAKSIHFTVQSVERQGSNLAVKFDLVSQREKANLYMDKSRVNGVSVGGAEFGCSGFQLGNANPGPGQIIYLSEGDHYPLTVLVPMRAAAENSVKSLSLGCRVNDNWIYLTFENLVADGDKKTSDKH